MHLYLAINEMEQSSLQPLHAPGVPPPNSGCIHPSPTAEHMSQADGNSRVVQGLQLFMSPLLWAPTGGIIKAWPHFNFVMVLIG
jgi:hypothetical protein